MRRHGEGETDIHSDRVALDRRIDEFLDARELDDLVEPPAHLAPAHAENGAIEEDVLAATELGMETGADLEQAVHAALDFDAPRRGFRDARQDLQQGGLAGAVAADDAD